MRSLVLAGVALAAFAIAGPARAADLPSLPAKAPPAPAAPVYDWSGFYIGANAGYGVAVDPITQTFTQPGFTDTSTIASRVTPRGGLFGAQLGYNVQAGHLVYGVEGDLQWTGRHDTSCGLGCFTDIIVTSTESAEQRLKWFGTARGRLGWSNDGWLFYVTGGAAWGVVDATTAQSLVMLGVPLIAGSNTTRFVKAGGVVGGGAEVRLGGPWTAKFEFLYVDLGSISDTMVLPPPAVAAGLTTNSAIHDHIVRIGLNYKFNNAGPAAAADVPALPLKAPPRTMAQAYDWSGFYVGANAGYGLATDPFDQLSSNGLPIASSVNSRVTPKGGLFGGQLGYNVQAGHVVFGVEGDLQWANQHDTAGCGLACSIAGGGGGVTFGSAEQRIKWFGTARGRLGWASDGWLFYVTGGAARGAIDATTGYSDSTGVAAASTTSFTKTGAVVGAGTELRLAGPWTAKVEYLHINFGAISDTLASPVIFAPLTTNSTIHDNVVRAGLNYKFDGSGPPVTAH